ncbi:MAG: ATP-binding protein [Gammaproteobacteria bacterium]
MNAPAPEMDVFDFELPAAPYPGLRPFAKREWPIFFGRERMIDEVLERLIHHTLLVVHGDSGCGKSSLIRAGVLPRLEQECARGAVHWITAITSPGDSPVLNLAGALASLVGGPGQLDAHTLEFSRLLNSGRKGAEFLAKRLLDARQEHICILIDQFEEIFAHARRNGPQQARLLIDHLIGLYQLPQSRLRIVLTMRSEFLGSCAQFEGFAEVVNDTQYLLPRMEHPDLVRAIRETASLYEGEITADFADRLIADAGGSQDQLPLIQHGLMVLYRKYVAAPGEPWRLTLDRYPNSGGLGQLLSDHADEVMTSIQPAPGTNDDCPGVVAELFRALTDINADHQAVRNPQKLRDLVKIAGASPATVQRVIDAFRAEGISFLRPYGNAPMQDEDYVDISHEALIRCWKRIGDERTGWLTQEFKDGLIWRSLLVQAESFERDPSNVLSPATTEERRKWLSCRNEAWSLRYGGGWSRVQKLIVASEAERDRQVQEDAAERAREENARLEQAQAKLRERELQTKVARSRVYRWGLAISSTLLVFALYSAWSAHKAGVRASNEQARAELAAQDLQKSFALAEAKRAQAEMSLVTIRSELEQLKASIAGSTESSDIKQRVARAESSISQQVDLLSKAARLSPRLYIHIAQDSQRTAARELELRIEAAQLGESTVIVPGIQLVDAPPPYPLLRCFVAAECKLYGQQLLNIVNGSLEAPRVKLQDFSGTYTAPKEGPAIRPLHFELYFPAGEIRVAIPRATAK